MPIPKSSITNLTINPYAGRDGLVYARVSSKRQETDGSGLGSQEGRCINELELLGVPYDKTFPDTFTGGGDFMKRPAMREMLAYIDKNPHKKFVVVFDDLKRFARDVNFHFKLKAEFKSRDVLLRCLNFNFEDSPEGEFVETIMAAGAQLERNQNRRQVIQKQKARLELGYWPFIAKRGYKMVKDPAHGKISVPDEKDKDLLISALEGFAKGTFVRKIDACRFLVERGFWNRPAEKSIVQFNNILKSSFYAGFIEHAPWEVSRIVGKHQALISEDMFNLIQKRLKNDGRNKRVRVDVSEDFPLRGIVLCADCHEPLRAAWSKGRSKKYPFYVCHNKAVCPAYGKSIKKKDIEDRFDEVLKDSTLKQEVGQLVSVMFDRVWEVEVKDFHGREAQVARLEDERKLKIKQLAEMAMKARTEKLRRVYEAQIEEMPDGETSLDPSQKIDLTVPYRTALDKATAMLKNPYDVWQKVSVIEKQRLYYFIFDKRIAYSRENGYRTAEASSFSLLFEGFVKQNAPSFDEAPCMVDQDNRC